MSPRHVVVWPWQFYVFAWICVFALIGAALKLLSMVPGAVWIGAVSLVGIGLVARIIQVDQQRKRGAR